MPAVESRIDLLTGVNCLAGDTADTDFLPLVFVSGSSGLSSKRRAGAILRSRMASL